MPLTERNVPTSGRLHPSLGVTQNGWDISGAHFSIGSGGVPTGLPRLHAQSEYVFRVPLRRLIGADNLEVLVDKHVVWPVDADVVDLVLAVGQLHNTVDDSSRVCRQRRFRRSIGCHSTDDRS